MPATGAVMPMWWNGACQNVGAGGWMFSHGVFSLLLLLLAIAAIAVLVRLIVRPAAPPPEAGGRSSALDVLEKRYASGEIDRDEYLQKKSDLGG